MNILATTYGGTRQVAFERAFPKGNMPHGIDGQSLTQSQEGIHLLDFELKNLCAELLLPFNIVAFLDKDIMVIEIYNDGMTISFRSIINSKQELPKCFYEALEFIVNKEPEKGELVQAILLSYVGCAMFNEEIDCTLSSQEEAIKLFNAENSAKV